MIKMTNKAQRRVKILEMVKEKQIKQTEAADRLGVSYRQLKRIYKTYNLKGDEALNHGLIGKQGNNRTDEFVKEMIMKIVRNEFKDYKPTFISEKLLECYHVVMRSNTLRKWMMKEHLWEKTKKMSKHRNRRQRKEHFGEMIQMDGSPHDWLGIGQELCLMHMVDDSNNTAFGLFDTGETTDIALRALYEWITKYGVPQSIYSDHGGVFYVDREPSIEEQLKGINPKTRFGQVCEDLGIEMIYANSPQAKGRVERANGVQQDRLLNDLKYYGIKTMEDANRFLKNGYWDKHNSRFSKKSVSDADYHIPLFDSQDLRNLVCYKEERKISQDFVVRLNNRLFQLIKEQKIELRPRNEVIIKTWLDGSIHIFKKEIELEYREIIAKDNQNIA